MKPVPFLWCEKRDVEHPRRLCRLGASCMFARRSRSFPAQLATVSSPESSDQQKSPSGWMGFSVGARNGLTNPVLRRSVQKQYVRCHKTILPFGEGGVLRDFTQRQKGHRHEACTLFVVRETGLEPVRCEPHAPQTCASASSATLAFVSETVPFGSVLTRHMLLYTKKSVCQVLSRKKIFRGGKFFTRRFPKPPLTARPYWNIIIYYIFNWGIV